MRRLVLVFLKFPEPGRVKTRLARSIGPEAAAQASRRLAEGVFGVLAGSGGIPARVLYDPPEKAKEIRAWVSGPGGLPDRSVPVEFSPQAGGDLGHRLERAFADAFEDGYEAVAAIGTDCVDLKPATFQRTWEALEERDAVLGPSLDGGYYLVGLRAPRAELFRGIPWSSEDTLRASLAAAAAAGMSVELLEPLRDVDTVEDWEAVSELMKDEG